MPRWLTLDVDSPQSQLKTACVLEATARKPGNVHPAASFEDLTFEDFVVAAEVTGHVLGNPHSSSVGELILKAVQTTRERVGSNVNLGILLLLAPLSVIPRQISLNAGIHDVLQQLDVREARLVYRAILAAHPGGMGTASEQDLDSTPDCGLVECMQLAADRDTIARQYVNGFADVLETGRAHFLNWWRRTAHWEMAVIGTQLELMKDCPDTLIARKCGWSVAEESATRAKQVLQTGWPETDRSFDALSEFDNWLRSDGHRRNPGTTADVIAAILYALIREGDWTPPSRVEIPDRPLPPRPPS